MAHVATVTIVVDESDKDSVYDGLNELLRDAQYGGPNGENMDWIVDWKFQSVVQANEAINNSIANGTYAEGDAFDSIRYSLRDREDAERYRWLRSQAKSQADDLGPMFTIEVRRMKDETLFSFDKAVDAARQKVPVKREPAFEPFKLVVEAYATDEFGEGPPWAEVTVTPEFLQTLERLRRICQDENLESVTVQQGPDLWDMEDDLRIRGDSLRVWRDDFWFEAHPKHADYNVETRSILIDHLVRVARKISSDDVENPLPDGFAIRNGIVFYGASDPENLADLYFEEAKDESAATVCNECGEHTDGAEVCQACFDAGRGCS